MLLLSRADAQERRTIGTATTFHKDPNGTVLASLPVGTAFASGTVQGGWIGLTLDGWVPSSAVQASSRDGFDLVVSARNGQELRAAPDGNVLARLRYGVLLERVGTRGNWVHVRRAGWTVRSALRADRGGQGRTGADAAADSAEIRRADSARAVLERDTTPVTEGRGRVETLRAAAIHTAPQSGRVGSLAEGAPVRVVTRAGEWVRVQVDGWMKAEDLSEQSREVLVGVSAAELRADPDRFVGQEVQWRVQYIALRTADELRPELPAGEPYLLVRGPLPEAGFVYVMIPRDAVERFRALQPLANLTIRAVVRAPRTRHLPTPIVELRSWEGVGGEAQ